MAQHATPAPADGASRITPMAFDVPTAARHLSIGQSKLWMLIREGRVKVAKIDRRTLVSRAELERIAAEGC